MIHPCICHSSVDSGYRSKILSHSLRTHQIHPRFLYESPESSLRWLQVHKKYSPVQNQKTFSIYQKAYDELAAKLNNKHVQVVSLGCGGGNKDRPLLATLFQHGYSVHYIPC